MSKILTFTNRLHQPAVVWSWAFNFLRLAAGVLLLPLLLTRLSPPDLGMYYVFLRLVALVPIIDFGFSHYQSRHWIPKFGLELESITAQCGHGRVAVYGLGQLYGIWCKGKTHLSPAKRRISLGFRILFWKVPVQYIVPLTARWFDTRLPGETCASGLMIAARRFQSPPALSKTARTRD